MPAALNLSNEVVKMRAEVKRVKVLVLRKLTRQITVLKRRKGTQADLERNQRRVARLIEEIHKLKTLAPDSITKAALQQDISYQKVCQNKAASLSERAMARVATHPEFSWRIQSLKDAIKAFKAERLSAAKAQKKIEPESGGSVLQQSDLKIDDDNEEESEEEDKEEELRRIKEHEGDDGSSVIQKADVEGFDKITKQNPSVSVTTKEKSIKAGSTSTEVVRMRKEVKKMRILVLRKLTQQITSLRREQDKESGLKGNQQCLTRLKMEIQVLRTLSPDHVTTTVLQGKVDLENVLQDPNSSSLERATARIATHPHFIKKLQDVRKAIEEEKAKLASDAQKNEGKEDFSEMTEHSDDEVEEDVEDKSEEDATVIGDGGDDEKKEKDQPFNVIKMSNAVKLTEDNKPHVVKDTPGQKSNGGANKQDVTSSVHLKSVSTTPVTAGIANSLPSKSKDSAVSRTPPPERKALQRGTRKPENRSKEESDSDVSDGDEEREYFDDSTEERFHKQSSQSEESDDDDFFLGKVSKLKKKKSDAAPEKEKQCDSTKLAKLQKAKEASEARHEFTMRSVFCSTLSKSSDASQKGRRCDPKPPHLQNQKKCADGDAKPSWFKSQGPRTDRRRVAFNKPAAGPKGPGPGARGGKQPSQGYRGGPGIGSNRSQPSQQALHPSWEASRKRKEQQAQITAFQGKKIKFDDD